MRLSFDVSLIVFPQSGILKVMSTMPRYRRVEETNPTSFGNANKAVPFLTTLDDEEIEVRRRIADEIFFRF
jgi:hypothetical protein